VIHGEAQNHLQQEERAEAPKWLEVAGVEGSHPSEKADDKEDACRCSHGSLIEYRSVDSGDQLTKTGLFTRFIRF